MLSKVKIFKIIVPIIIMLNINTLLADSDMSKSKDHSKIPRIEGTTIIGFAESDYDEGVFIKGSSSYDLSLEKVEGKRTRILYVAPKNLSPLGILRNYQKAFDNLGKVNKIYSCKDTKCPRNLDIDFIWRSTNQIANNIKKQKGYLYDGDSYQVYWYGTVSSATSLYHISLHSTIILRRTSSGPYEKRIAEHSVIYLEITEVTDFKPSLVTITAKDINSKISEKGHISLYGIHFDLNNDKLKHESNLAIEQIAQALKKDVDLNIYVVGHTDNQGSLKHNKDLSERRAKSVVEKLISEYKVDGKRIIPKGVGSLAPISTNNTKEGRALNRRVDLVNR